MIAAKRDANGNPGPWPGLPFFAPDARASVGVGAAALLAYLLLAPPVAGDKDSAELALVLITLGVAHPTGYPLFTLFGHAFVIVAHALGAGWIWAANAWSAVGGALALGLLHRLAVALLPAGAGAKPRAQLLTVLAPMTAAALFGANPIWSYECTMAEVYSWHLAWTAGAALLALRLARAAARSDVPPGAPAHGALAWGLLCGVGLAHHLSSVLVSGPLTLALAWLLVARRRLTPATVLATAGGLAVPLLAYGLIAWRTFHPATVQWPPLVPSWSGFRAHVTGQAYQHLVGRWDPSPEQRVLLARYLHPFLWPGLALLAAAAAAPARDRARRGVLAALLAAALAQAAVAFRYGVSDPSSFFLPSLALGLMALPAAAARPLAGGARSRRWATAGLWLAVAATLALLVPWSRTSVERRRGFVANERLLHEMWSVIPGDEGIVFWPNDAAPQLRVYQLIGHEKTGLAIYHPFTLTHPVPRARFRERFGFDPLEGVRLPTPADLDGPGGPLALATEVDDIVRNVNRRTRLPVIVFDPTVPTVKLLTKDDAPGAPPAKSP